MTYRVYLNGELDLDENGEVFTPWKDFTDISEAAAEAAAYELESGYLTCVQIVGYGK